MAAVGAKRLLEEAGRPTRARNGSAYFAVFSGLVTARVVLTNISASGLSERPLWQGQPGCSEILTVFCLRFSPATLSPDIVRGFLLNAYFRKPDRLTIGPPLRGKHRAYSESVGMSQMRQKATPPQLMALVREQPNRQGDGKGR
jgi:hypothetical protein